ncbi:MAG: RnfH family protein [Gammaproteobacteria bacterium]|nr:RnfH family protein [Gammaproteobacteria bacterium]
MANVEEISVEVAYALPEQQQIVTLSVASNATIEDVIRASGLLDHYPEIDLGKNKVGVFGKLGKLTDTLHAGDRVEIYRPLIADPKEVRKKRAAAGKVMKKGAAELAEKNQG